MNNSMSIIDQINYTLRFHSSNLASQDNYTRFLELLEFKRNLECELSSLGNSCERDDELTQSTYEGLKCFAFMNG